MSKWTQDRIKRFWEKCGFREHFEFDTGAGYWESPDGKSDPNLPHINDLNALFKWAVPVVTRRGYQTHLKNISDGWHCMLYGCLGTEPRRIETLNPDLTLALAEAIEKALEVGDE